MGAETFEVKLPSRGLAYDVPVEAIRMKYVTGSIEQVLAEVSLDNFDEKTHLALSMLVEGIDAKMLTLGDRLALLVQSRINSYTKMYPIETVCDQCLEKVDIDIDLSAVEIRTLPDDFKQTEIVQFSDGNEVNVRLFRIADELNISRYEAQGGKEGYLYRLAQCIDAPNLKNIEEKMIVLRSIRAVDIAKIKAYHEKNQHGLRLDAYKYVCPRCGMGATTPIPFRPELILPDGSTVAKYS